MNMEGNGDNFTNEKILNYIFHEFNKFIDNEDESYPKKSVKQKQQERHRRILREILKSEDKYLACLRTILRLKTDLDPDLNGEKFIKKDDFDIIFFKAQELHDLHNVFHDSLKQQVVQILFSSFDSFGMRIEVSQTARPQLIS